MRIFKKRPKKTHSDEPQKIYVVSYQYENDSETDSVDLAFDTEQAAKDYIAIASKKYEHLVFYYGEYDLMISGRGKKQGCYAK